MVITTNKLNKLKNSLINDLKVKNISFELVGEFKNRATKTKFKCLKCGAIISATPHNIVINKRNCPKCGPKRRVSFNELKENIKIKTNNKIYLLSKESDICGTSGKFSVNKNAIFKSIECDHHFETRISKVLYGELKGCPICYKEKNKTSNDIIQEKLNKIYNKQFYLVSDYKSRREKIKVLCNKCNKITEDFAFNFITNKRGCSYCSKSAIEQRIETIFNNINSKITFDDLKITNKLSYDFEINNILYECDGEQHFYPIDHFGGINRFKEQQSRDILKNNYAKKHNLTLIRFYSNKNISDEKLKKLFGSTTIENIEKEFTDILVISDGSIRARKGLYTSIEVE